jgi:hypothetical protein
MLVAHVLYKTLRYCLACRQTTGLLHFSFCVIALYFFFVGTKRCIGSGSSAIAAPISAELAETGEPTCTGCENRDVVNLLPFLVPLLTNRSASVEQPSKRGLAEERVRIVSVCMDIAPPHLRR